MKPQINYDERTDSFSISGVRLASTFFHVISQIPTGTLLRVDRRTDGILTLTQVEKEEFS